LGWIINALLTYDRDPGRVENEFAETVSAIKNIFGNTTRSIENWLSLLKLPAEMHSALKEGTLPVSQGYIFTANLDNHESTGKQSGASCRGQGNRCPGFGEEKDQDHR
jgi:hypothetical protein